MSQLKIVNDCIGFVVFVFFCLPARQVFRQVRNGLTGLLGDVLSLSALFSVALTGRLCIKICIIFSFSHEINSLKI
jgi:hypothetical protein